jgi:hypothetical protein
MYRPPLRHEKPHIAVGVVADPRPRDSGDIGLAGAASASPKPSPISMPATSPNFTNSLCIASPHVRSSKPLTGGQVLLRQSPPEASRLPLRRAASAFYPATSWPHPRRLASTRLDRSARPSASRRFGAKIPPHVGDHRPDPSYHANPRLNFLGHNPDLDRPGPILRASRDRPGHHGAPYDRRHDQDRAVAIGPMRLQARRAGHILQQ